MTNTMKETINSFKKAFTIIELLIVITVIGILSTILVVAYSSMQADARDKQRETGIKVVAESLEKYYQQYGEYPDCATMAGTPSGIVDRLKGLDPNVLTSPSDDQGVNSFACNTNPATDKYAYFGGGGEFTLKYREEGTGSIKSVGSRKHGLSGSYTLALDVSPGSSGTVTGGGVYAANSVRAISATPAAYYSFDNWSGSTGCASESSSKNVTMDSNKACTATFEGTPIVAPAAPVVTVVGGSTSTWSWNGATCGTNTAGYQYRYTISNGYNSGLVNTSATSVEFTTSTTGQLYTVEVFARCTNPVVTGPWSTSDSASYLASPSAPTVSSSISGTSAVGTWSASCGLGTSVEYEYRTNYNDGDWSSYSDWGSSTTASVSADQGQKYGFNVIARCIDGESASSSSSSNTSYIVRPISQPAAATWATPYYFITGYDTTVVNFSSHCPAGTWGISKVFNSRANWSWQWFGPHSWGYEDWWDRDRDTITYSSASYFPTYACQSSYTTSSTSASTEIIISACKWDDECLSYPSHN